MPAVPVLPVDVIPPPPPPPLHALTIDAIRAAVANAAEKTIRIMPLLLPVFQVVLRVRPRMNCNPIFRTVFQRVRHTRNSRRFEPHLAETYSQIEGLNR